jgi:GNAT superfamily N-acetyltransferase
VHVVRAGVDDTELVRDLRLAALADAPDAFCTDPAVEACWSAAEWQRWCSGGPGATFLVRAAEGGAVGLVRAVPDASGCELEAMWVAPGARGGGAADLLVGAVVDWAAAAGAGPVHLEVIDGNHRARALYERHGFRPAGEPTCDGAGRARLRMVRPS